MGYIDVVSYDAKKRGEYGEYMMCILDNIRAFFRKNEVVSDEERDLVIYNFNNISFSLYKGEEMLAHPDYYSAYTAMYRVIILITKCLDASVEENQQIMHKALDFLNLCMWLNICENHSESIMQLREEMHHEEILHDIAISVRYFSKKNKITPEAYLRLKKAIFGG